MILAILDLDDYGTPQLGRRLRRSLNRVCPHVTFNLLKEMIQFIEEIYNTSNGNS
jgi:hypothetical protein